MDVFQQGRADDATAEPLKNGRYVVALACGDRPEQALDIAGRKDDKQSKRNLRQVAPGMRHALVHGDRFAGSNLRSPVVISSDNQPCHVIADATKRTGIRA